MTWADLLWFPPVMLGVAIVLGTAGADEGVPGALRRSILRTFVLLCLCVLGVGLAIHVVASVFSG